MTLLRTWRHNLVVTAVVAVLFALLYQAQTIDSRYAARQAVYRETAALPSPGARLRFSATAYCKGDVTASGVVPRTGVAAADPALLPVGSVVQITSDSANTGIYTIMDTGPAVQGRHIDIYMWSCYDALRFGRRSVDVVPLRLGWDPRTSGASVRDALLNRRPAPAAAAPTVTSPPPAAPAAPPVPAAAPGSAR
jgi:3D (Asp-Asp-Asp) domain-containing protein